MEEFDPTRVEEAGDEHLTFKEEDDLFSSTPISVDAAQARNKAAVDINFFAALCLPDVMQFNFPRYYVSLFQFLITSMDSVMIAKVLRIAVGLPRGFAKSTFLKVICCYLVCHDRISFLLIICATEDLAENFVADINSMMGSPNLELLYGKWTANLAIDNKLVKKCAYREKILIVRGAGAGTAVRGLLMDHKRPDFILCDDMQTTENAASETDRQRLALWFVGTLLKVVTPFRSVVFYIGNMTSEDCILFQLKSNESWLSMITGAILADGTSLWPEIHSIDSLWESWKHDESLGLGDVWFAEIMNDPVPRAGAMINGPLPMFRGEFEPDAAFITVDPAGMRSGADDNVVTGHYIFNNKGYIAEMAGGQWDPKETVRQSIHMALRTGASLIGIEDVAYQQSLAYWVAFWLKYLKIEGIQVVGIKTGRQSKDMRIRSWFKEVYAGEYFFMRDEDRQKVAWQATAYRREKKNNKDDWMDSPAMAIKVRNEFSHMLHIVRHERTPEEGLVFDNTPF